MYYVYFLKSGANGDMYVGYSEDLKKRIETHNKGLVKGSQYGVPWRLVYFEAYSEETIARKRELEIKQNHAAKTMIMRRIEA